MLQGWGCANGADLTQTQSITLLVGLRLASRHAGFRWPGRHHACPELRATVFAARSPLSSLGGGSLFRASPFWCWLRGCRRGWCSARPSALRSRCRDWGSLGGGERFPRSGRTAVHLRPRLRGGREIHSAQGAPIPERDGNRAVGVIQAGLVNEFDHTSAPMLVAPPLRASTARFMASEAACDAVVTGRAGPRVPEPRFAAKAPA